jgi:hypothetical protein
LICVTHGRRLPGAGVCPGNRAWAEALLGEASLAPPTVTAARATPLAAD